MITQISNIQFHIYEYDKINKYVDTDKGIIIGEDSNKIVELIKVQFYWKNIYYLKTE